MLKSRLIIILVSVGLLVIVCVAGVQWVQCVRKHRARSAALREEADRVSKARLQMGPCGTSYVRVYGPSGDYNRFELNFRGSKIDDEKLKNLEGLTSIVGLDLSENPITDAGLASLSKLVGLEYLQISQTEITNEGLARLSGLHNLQAIDLAGTSITQDAASHLERLPRLKVVYAAGTRLTAVKGVRVDTEHASDCWIRDGDPLKSVTAVHEGARNGCGEE